MSDSVLSRFRLRRKKGRHSVLIGLLPDDFTPSGPTTVPPTMSSMEVEADDCTLAQAVALLRVFNSEQLAARIPDRKWAVLAFVSRSTKGGGI